jgi:pre-mRNA-splicing factor 18
MEAIKAEIERKRKQLADSNVLVSGGKKYFKRSELIAKNEEDYLKRHGLLKVDEPKVNFVNCH